MCVMTGFVMGLIDKHTKNNAVPFGNCIARLIQYFLKYIKALYITLRYNRPVHSCQKPEVPSRH